MDNNNDILTGLDEEEQKRLQKIEKLDSNQSRKKFIFAGVTVFLITLFVLGTVFGGKYILSFEGSQALPEKEFATPTQAGAEALAFVDELILETENYNSVKLDSYFRVSIDGDSIKTVSNGGDDELNTELLKTVRGQVQDKLRSIYSVYRHEGKYGEDFSEYLPEFEFPVEQAKTAELTVNEDNPAELIGRFTFEGCKYDEVASKPVYKIFDLDDVDDIIKSVDANFQSDIKINSLDIDYTDFNIDAYISREHDGDVDRHQATKLVYSRNCTVQLNATFIGDLAEYGTQDIVFDLRCEEEYQFSYISFKLTRPLNFIEKGNSDEVHRKVNTDESAQDIHIVWESSDPEILSVDEKGFYKGKKVSEKPVTVKGTYTYNGIEYTDECIFYVRVPAESVKLSKKSVVMNVGDETTLEPTVKPENATFKNVYWFSTDESIVTVENGVVKAIAPGEAGVYVITFDGNFKKTCTVTVEG